jgi:CHAD domain-containing protein
VAKARAIPGLGEDDPYAVAAAKVVSVRAQELADLSANVLDMDDIERVHDMRVATRRLRAALEVFEPCFPEKPYGSTLKRVKELADALGERRDHDVTIAALNEFSESIGRSDRPGVSKLVERIRVEQAEANDALAPYVTKERIAELTARLDELLDGARALVPAGRHA